MPAGRGSGDRNQGYLWLRREDYSQAWCIRLPSCPINSRLAPAEQAATWTVPFPIDGMTCASCTSDITNAMSRQQGISHFQVDLMSETQTSRPQTRARQTPPERRSRTSATTTRSCRSSQSLFHANLQHHSPSTAPILPSEA